MENTILALFNGIIRTYVIYKYMEFFFHGSPVSYRKKQASYIFLYLYTVIPYLAFHHVGVNVFVHISGFFLLTLVYERKLIKNFFISAFIYATDMGCDFLVFSLFTTYIQDHEVKEFWGIFTVILMYIVYLILQHVITERRHPIIPEHVWACMLFIPIISIGAIVLIFKNFLLPEYRNAVVSIIFCILLLNVLAFNLYNMVFKAYLNQLDLDCMKKQLTAYDEQFAILEQEHQRYASLIHDFRHHNQMIRNLACKEEQVSDHSALQDYLKKSNESLPMTRKIANSGNPSQDSILNYHFTRAEEMGIDLTIDVQLPYNLSANFYNLNIILGNLLENAIEAASHSQEKVLYFKLGLKHKNISIQIKNSHDGNIHFKNGEYLSTKQTDHPHGLGLKNIQKILNLNHSLLENRHDEHFFYTKLLYFLNF